MTVANVTVSKGEKYAAGYQVGEEEVSTGSKNSIGKNILLRDADAKRGYQDAIEAHKHRTQYHAK